MSHLLVFTKNLNLPKDVIDSLQKPRTNEELKVYAQTLPQLLYPDTYKLAGKLLIYLNIKSSPKTILRYVEILDSILNKDFKDFVYENHTSIDKLLLETYDSNFDYDIMSASSCVNYLLRVSPDEESIETPCQLYLRQAIQFYHDEGMEKVERCYRELIDKQYVHASPTMFNAGTKKNQMSSCFLLTIGDNLESLLYTGVGDVGMISKAQGGIGLSLNAVRHSSIANTGKSSGVLPFAKIYDDTIKCVDQGGKRNGAMTITLNAWHIDFLEFIQCRDNFTQNGIRLKQANICAYIPSEFMRRVRNNQEWTLFCPSRAVMEIDGKEVKLLEKHSYDFDRYYKLFEIEAEKRQKEFDELNEKIVTLEVHMNSGEQTQKQEEEYYYLCELRRKLRKKLIIHKKINAVDVYEKLCDMHIKSSMPYIVYSDTVNYKNNMKNIGSVEGLNLCLEITEPSTPDSIASCNLAHINLKRFVKKEFTHGTSITECYDFDGLAKASQSLVRNLNKVIDFNRYPLDKHDSNGICVHRDKISIPNLNNRPLGIGVSGLAEVFANLNIYYDSDTAYYLNRLIFACMYYNCLLESCTIAIDNKLENGQYGHYNSFKTGSFKAFVEGVWNEYKGSPLSNGMFQFDMWKQESNYLKSIDSLDEKTYDPNDDIPVEPMEWGQTGEWLQLRKLIMKNGVYNSMFLAPMPTASSAQMLNNAETTEAHQTLIYSRKLAHGNYTAFSEPFIQDMISSNLWSQPTIDFIMMCNGSIKNIDKFIIAHPHLYDSSIFNEDKTMFTDDFKFKLDHLKKKHRGMYEISQKVCLKMARQRGIYIDQSQSLNIYLPEPNMRQLKAVHDYSERLRLKTGMYYLRVNPASQTDRFTVDIEVQKFYSSLFGETPLALEEKPKQKKKPQVICTDEVCIMCQ